MSTPTMAEGQIEDANPVETPATFEGATPFDDSPIRGREVFAVIFTIIVADLLLYRGHGYFGVATFFALSAAVLGPAMNRLRWSIGLGMTSTVLALFCLRIVWLGNDARVIAAICLLLALVFVAQQGAFLFRGIFYLSVQMIFGGIVSFIAAGANHPNPIGRFGTVPRWLSLLLPLLALGLFGTLFILANPAISELFATQFAQLRETMIAWLEQLTLPAEEVVLWAVIALLATSALRPLLFVWALPVLPMNNHRDEVAKQEPAKLYLAYRNTFLALIGLFVVYLGFEFSTLWFREFPDGFYYAGYAHRGAFWLTVALAIATVVLSVGLRGEMLHDPRLKTLKRLAWIWSGLNGLLALAVYHRLMIYVGFNGMTHMRIIGFLGITTVVVGFILVLVKIARDKSFFWLASCQAWALAIGMLVYAFLPIDAIAARYNVRRILGGDISAVMQIGVQPLDTEAALTLTPLLECQEPEIRDGVRALLAEHHARLKALQDERQRLGWTAKQFADDYALGHLEAISEQTQDYRDKGKRQEALKAFYDYAYQWY